MNALTRRLVGGLLCLCMAVGLTLGSAQPAPAQSGSLRIAAVVNDEIISLFDLEVRLSLTLLGASLPNTRENRQRLAGQVLRAMIDEKLQMQEAKRIGITVSDQEIAEAIRRIEMQNQMPQGGLDRMLAGQNIPRQTLEEQLRAALAWRRVVARRFSSGAEISDEEINEQLAQIEARRGQPEVLVKEILLPVDTPEREAEVRSFAERLVSQYREGAPFEGLAQQFSQSASARVGGDIGWIGADALDEPLAQAIADLPAGQITEPIRTVLGFYILKVEDRRIREQAPPSDAMVSLRQIALPVPLDAPPERLQEVAGRMREAVAQTAGCETLPDVAKSLDAPAPIDLGRVRQGDLSPAIRDAVATVEVGKASAPVPLPGGVSVFVVCDRESVMSDLPSRPEIRQRLENEKLEVLARRLMRDLKRAAFIDIRI
ncbi:peptidylprolyl isomerase [Oceanibaculum indicum]|uniref:Parvulin-like PPIase n=1 Tax=Oceanibaculum indicum P24 TaxID=1207063 RepID=K2K085_9PROT|nr:peptidylprolyl isomerase [Oceanibaculum indicum]EKE76109.1 Parvulin-like peptidyl-prolyl isomerase [Oceanibaculum indicum P24]